MPRWAHRRYDNYVLGGLGLAATGVGVLDSYTKGYPWRSGRKPNRVYLGGKDITTSFSQSDMPAVTPRKSKSRSVSRGRKRAKSDAAGVRPMSTDSRSVFKFRGRSRSAKAGKRVSFVPTHETGYVGRFGKAKQRSRRKASAFDKYGAVLKREYNFSGSTIEDAECVYIGHGLPVGQVVRQALRSAYRSLLRKAGYDFNDWNDDFEGNNFVLNLTWTIGAGTLSTGTSITMGTSGSPLSHYTITDNLATAVDVAVSDANALDSIQFQILTILVPADAENQPLARLNLNQFHVQVDYYSIMKVKNVSLAADELDGDLTTNVNAQPLVGKVYKTGSWNNGFQPVKEKGGGSSLAADPTTGAFAIGASSLSNQAGLNPYRKPPPGYVFGEAKSGTIRLNPGEVKSDVIKFKAKMLFNTLMTKLIANVNNLNNSGDLRGIGCAGMIGLEREVGFSSAAAANISLLAQVDFVLKIKGQARWSKVPPITLT